MPEGIDLVVHGMVRRACGEVALDTLARAAVGDCSLPSAADRTPARPHEAAAVGDRPRRRAGGAR